MDKQQQILDAAELLVFHLLHATDGGGDYIPLAQHLRNMAKAGAASSDKAVWRAPLYTLVADIVEGKV